MSVPDFNSDRSTQPEKRSYEIRLLGTGAAAPTVEAGPGTAVTRNSIGNYRITFDDPPGTFIGLSYGLQAATPADLAGHTVIADTWVKPTATADGYLDVVLYSAADAAHDLAADEYMLLEIKFSKTNIVPK